MINSNDVKHQHRKISSTYCKKWLKNVNSYLLMSSIMQISERSPNLGLTCFSDCWLSTIPFFPQLLSTYTAFCPSNWPSYINQLHYSINSSFFASHFLKMMDGICLLLWNIFSVEISKNLAPNFWLITLHLTLHAGKSPTSLFYIKIPGLSYLHVKFHDAEGILTI